jgi:GxxExxY protein
MRDTSTDSILACAIKVHSVLGPGFTEKVYSRALRVELGVSGIPFEHEKTIRIFYEGRHIANHVLDLVVQGVVVELKARTLGAADYKQIRSYMKAAKLHSGLLINFAGPRIDIRRVEISDTPQ